MSQEELESVAGERDVWVSLLDLTSDKVMKMDRWIISYTFMSAC